MTKRINLGSLFEALMRKPANVDLQHAALKGHTARVRQLLESGTASPNTMNFSRWTALHSAALNGHTEIAKLLIEAGADPTKANADGERPRDIAINRRHMELAFVLSAAEKRRQPKSKKTLVP